MTDRPPVPALARGKVGLRAHRDDDVDRVLEQGRDPDSVRWTSVPQPYGRRQAREYLAGRPRGWADGSELSFAITHRGQFAGTVDLRPEGQGGATIGYGLHPDCRGRRVGSGAVRLALQWGFDELGLDVVHWRAAVGNWASRRLAWSVGFRVEGTVRGLLVIRGQRHDAWIGSIRRGDPLAPPHVWLDPVPVTGRAVRLREHRDRDLDRVVEGCNDPAVQRWLAGIPAPYTRQDAIAHREAISEDHAAGRSLYWAVADADDRLVGEVGLFGLRAGASRLGELGYWAHPDSRGRGLTVEAVRLAARHALLAREDGGLGLHRVLVRAAEDNLGSQRVAQRAGFRPAGRDRGAGLRPDGTRYDDLRFDLLAEELPAALPAEGLPAEQQPNQEPAAAGLAAAGLPAAGLPAAGLPAAGLPAAGVAAAELAAALAAEPAPPQNRRGGKSRRGKERG